VGSHFQPAGSTAMDENFVKSHNLEKLSGNLYLVPFNFIDRETFSPTDDEDFLFLNPRIICETYDTNPIGLDNEDMDYLKNSIQQKGLLTPLIARFKDEKICLINGHRRYLAIERLIKNDEICYDNNKNIKAKASETYSNVLVKIFSGASEIDSYILAFEEDKTKVKFGLGVEYKFVEFCLQKNVSDEKIIKMTGNTVSWLESVKQLFDKLNGDCPVDKDILDAVYTNKMSIGAAKSLADIQDPKERQDEFHNSFRRAEEETVAKKEKLNKQIKNLNKKADSAKAQSLICGTAGDAEGKKSADDILSEVLAEEKDIKSKQNSISTVVTANNVHAKSVGPRMPKNTKTKVNKDSNGVPEKEGTLENVSDPKLSISKNFLVQNWLNKIVAIEDGEIEGMEIDSNLQEITADLINCLINDQSCEDFLVHWSKELQRKTSHAE
jgi:ParB-like chromosome segregation protein Spo0J